VKHSLQPQSLSGISQEEDKRLRDSRCRLLARCYLKLGQWQEALQGLSEDSIPAVLQYYQIAREHDPNWYKAWHAWAYMNFETVLFYKHQQQLHGDPGAGGAAGRTDPSHPGAVSCL